MKQFVQKFFLLFFALSFFLNLSHTQTTIYVDQGNSSGSEDGESWSTAYTALYDALNSATSGDEIWVADGTYYPTDDTDRDSSFNLVEGVGVYGGFAGTESSSDDRDWETYETILSGDIGTADDNSDNVYHVVVGSDDAIIDGFTIQDGNADYSNDGSGCLIETTDESIEIPPLKSFVYQLTFAPLVIGKQTARWVNLNLNINNYNKKKKNFRSSCCQRIN